MKTTPKFSTELQYRLAMQVREGLAATGQPQHDLSRRTGVGEPHISLLLSGQRVGSVPCWGALISVAMTPKP